MRAMIVEDENNIREGISKLIDWEEEGFDTLILCSSAIDALEYLEKEKVELIITDIFMPVISGLEFVRMVRKTKPMIKFVILTGHERFELAQEAVELGVSRYLLKPVFPDKLLETVRGIKKELLEQIKIKDWITIAQQRLSEYMPVVKNQFWHDIVSNSIYDISEIKNRARIAEVSIDYEYMLCIAVGILKGELSLTTQIAMRQIADEIFKDCVVHTMPYEGIEMIIINKKIADSRLEILHRSLEKNLKLSVCFGIGSICSNINALYHSAEGAIEAVKTVGLTPGSFIMRYDDMSYLKENRREYPYEMEKKMLDMMRFREEFDNRLLKKFFEEILPPKNSLEDSKLMLLQFLVQIHRLANDYSIKTMAFFRKTEKSIDDFENIESSFKEMIELIIKGKKSMHQRHVSVMIEQIKNIIHNDFKSPELSVTYLADKLSVTPNYLSRVFSCETGQTCVEYITSIRLEAAKEMIIHSDMKSYEIAFEVGYNNPDYFSALFKKHAGVSPREFRERVKR